MTSFYQRQGDPQHLVVWGHSFSLTSEHLSAEQIKPLKATYDNLADECVHRLKDFSPLKAANPQPLHEPDQVKYRAGQARQKDYYELLKEHASQDEKLHQLWIHINTVPEWVDWDQVSRGQDVFYRYGGPALTALAYQSLLGGMGAPKVVETLVRTGGFSIGVARRRLLETTQYVLQVTNSVESLKPGGAGHTSSIRVRLLHAQVRQQILSLERSRPGYYDVENFGIPINDIDSMGTIVSFSASLIWLGFPRQGIWLREQEIIDYIALWRLLAHYMGTPTDHFETPDKAKRLMESLLMTEIDPSETSCILAKNVILCLQNQPPAYASHEFLTAGARWLIGNDLGDALGLSKPGIYHKALFAGQCLFFMALCYSYRLVPSWDRRKIETLRRLFYVAIVENKSYGLGGETNFVFKYVPRFNTKSVAGAHDGSSPEGVGKDRRNLFVLVIAGATTILLAWLIIRAVVLLSYTGHHIFSILSAIL